MRAPTSTNDVPLPTRMNEGVTALATQSTHTDHNPGVSAPLPASGIVSIVIVTSAEREANVGELRVLTLTAVDVHVLANSKRTLRTAPLLVATSKAAPVNITDAVASPFNTVGVKVVTDPAHTHTDTDTQKRTT